MTMFSITCPYCRQKIPINSTRCPECRAVIPHECGEEERAIMMRWFLIGFSGLMVLLLSGVLYLAYVFLF